LYSSKPEDIGKSVILRSILPEVVALFQETVDRLQDEKAVTLSDMRLIESIARIVSDAEVAPLDMIDGLIPEFEFIASSDVLFTASRSKALTVLGRLGSGKAKSAYARSAAKIEGEFLGVVPGLLGEEEALSFEQERRLERLLNVFSSWDVKADQFTEAERMIAGLQWVVLTKRPEIDANMKALSVKALEHLGTSRSRKALDESIDAIESTLQAAFSRNDRWHEDSEITRTFEILPSLDADARKRHIASWAAFIPQFESTVRRNKDGVVDSIEILIETDSQESRRALRRLRPVFDDITADSSAGLLKNRQAKSALEYLESKAAESSADRAMMGIDGERLNVEGLKETAPARETAGERVKKSKEEGSKAAGVTDKVTLGDPKTKLTQHIQRLVAEGKVTLAQPDKDLIPQLLANNFIQGVAGAAAVLPEVIKELRAQPYTKPRKVEAIADSSADRQPAQDQPGDQREEQKGKDSKEDKAMLGDDAMVLAFLNGTMDRVLANFKKAKDSLSIIRPDMKNLDQYQSVENLDYGRPMFTLIENGLDERMGKVIVSLYINENGQIVFSVKNQGSIDWQKLEDNAFRAARGGRLVKGVGGNYQVFMKKDDISQYDTPIDEKRLNELLGQNRENKEQLLWMFGNSRGKLLRGYGGGQGNALGTAKDKEDWFGYKVRFEEGDKLIFQTNAFLDKWESKVGDRLPAIRRQEAARSLTTDPDKAMLGEITRENRPQEISQMEYESEMEMLVINGKVLAPYERGDNTLIFDFPGSDSSVIRLSRTSMQLDKEEINNFQNFSGMSFAPMIQGWGKTDNGHPFLVVEKIWGDSLEKKDLFSSEDIVFLKELFHKILKERVFVADLKPSNIMIGRTKRNPRVSAYLPDLFWAEVVGEDVSAVDLAKAYKEYLGYSLPFHPEEDWGRKDPQGEIVSFLDAVISGEISVERADESGVVDNAMPGDENKVTTSQVTETQDSVARRDFDEAARIADVRLSHRASFPRINVKTIEGIEKHLEVAAADFKGNILVVGFGQNFEQILDTAKAFPKSPIWAVDIEGFFVDIAKEKMAKQSEEIRSRVSIVQGDVRDLNDLFQKGAFFDVVAYQAVLDMFEIDNDQASIRRLVDETYRLLKPGGLMISGGAQYGDVYVRAWNKGFDMLERENGPLLAAQKPDDSEVGGIDFNPDNIDLKTSGTGLNINIPQLDLEALQGPGFNGFTPVILEIVPITGLPMLLGELQPEDQPGRQASLPMLLGELDSQESGNPLSSNKVPAQNASLDPLPPANRLDYLVKL